MPKMILNESNIQEVKKLLKDMLELVDYYRRLTESYVIEFFVEDHWKKLPKSWQIYLQNLHPPEMAECFYEYKFKTAPPLSLMAFVAACKAFSLPRKKITKVDLNDQTNLAKSTDRFFYKHVSLKKQHEIKEMAAIISELYSSENCNSVLDIGSGRGHLSRTLSLLKGLNVSTIEMNKSLVDAAIKYDSEALQWFNKIKNTNEINDSNKLHVPRHNVLKLSPNGTEDHFIKRIMQNSDSDKHKILLTGLHACGDLSTKLYSQYIQDKSIKCILSVACCYMKLTDFGYPLSCFVKSLSNHKLNYKTKEISCHAVEEYHKQLKENGAHLMAHTYRATLEFIIRKFHPNFARERIQVGKKSYLMPFEEYVIKSFKSLNLPPPASNEILMENEIVRSMLSRWHNVITYYNITQMLAPVIESIILLDRMIYLYENGHSSYLITLFEPTISPRCFAIISSKS